MYEIILDVFAYMMCLNPCVFLFPKKRKRREVTWRSDFVSNSPQAPPADAISADLKTLKYCFKFILGMREKLFMKSFGG